MDQVSEMHLHDSPMRASHPWTSWVERISIWFSNACSSSMNKLSEMCLHAILQHMLLIHRLAEWNASLCGSSMRTPHPWISWAEYIFMRFFNPHSSSTDELSKVYFYNLLHVPHPSTSWLICPEHPRTRSFIFRSTTDLKVWIYLGTSLISTFHLQETN